ncbi:hypothetical protein HRbin36_00983 [bacterium HR36]|nr:hypothetical protein HRbin36_00983 [bacterium HR36]
MNTADVRQMTVQFLFQGHAIYRPRTEIVSDMLHNPLGVLLLRRLYHLQHDSDYPFAIREHKIVSQSDQTHDQCHAQHP